ncbi:MAG: hypothetical protein R2828_30850 [Saprospiraceae bacterium]
MGIIYSFGNTIQNLPFPSKYSLSSRHSLCISLTLSLLLLGAQWLMSMDTHSIALSVITILQTAISIFLSLFIIMTSKKDRIKLQRFRFIYLFLGSFFISLACGYLLFEAFDNFQMPVFRSSVGLFMAFLASILGNTFIIQILSAAQVIPFKVKTLQIPFFSIIIFSILFLGLMLFAQTLNWLIADPIIGLIATLFVFGWAAVTFLDAYWQMVESENNAIYS